MRLFEEAYIGKILLRNRLISSPVTPNYASTEGCVTDRTLEFYGARARGGVGLVITEGAYVHPTGKGYTNQLGIYSSRQLEGLTRLAEAIHAGGAKAAVQLHHAGRRADGAVSGFTPLSSSALSCYPKSPPPIELSTGQVEKIIEQHAKAAALAQKAGFDGIDIHGAHGYLIPSFLSAITNKRNDRYGGDTIQERARFAIELIQAIRGRVEKDFAVMIKLSGDEFVAGSCTIDQMRIVASLLENAGVDAITVSAGTVGGDVPFDPAYPQSLMRSLPMGTPQRAFAHLAAEIRKGIGIPVIAVGKIHNRQAAELVLSSGQGDFIALGRSLLADPDWPRKAEQGREDEIRPCISCNHGCFDRLMMQEGILCAVNPQIGQAFSANDRPAVRKKKVLVLGGGPAGMQAAVSAAERGHQVTLREKAPELGGQLLLAAVPPDRQEITLIKDHLIQQLDKKGVDVQLSVPWDQDMAALLAADAMVIAAGALPIIPGFLRDEKTKTAWDILKDKEPAPGHYLIIGGGLVGCETADMLSVVPGIRVTIVEMAEDIARDAGGDTKKFLIAKLNSRGVAVKKNTKLKEIKGGHALLEENCQEISLDYDYLILAMGAYANRGVADILAFAPGSPEIYVIGDCLRPRRILEAIADGDRIGRLL